MNTRPIWVGKAWTSTVALLPAAGETTTRTFGSTMVLLLERPELLARVHALARRPAASVEITNLQVGDLHLDLLAASLGREIVFRSV